MVFDFENDFPFNSLFRKEKTRNIEMEIGQLIIGSGS